MKKILTATLLLTMLISCETIFVENISDKAIEVLAPKGGAEIDGGTITFSWKRLDAADQYRLRIATPNFLNAAQIITDTIVSTTSFDKTMEVGDYEWIIVGENTDYQTVEQIYALTIK